MPELPEVEIITQQLKEILVGKKIISVEIFDGLVIDKKIKSLVPVEIKNVFRRAKSIVVELDNNKFMLTHLRMTGHFHHITFEDDLRPRKFLVAKFFLSDNSILTHNSIRKFGGIKLVDEKELKEYFSKLGPEPFDINANEFYNNTLRYPKANIKTKILDQSFIAGVGNIYVQEALYYAGIDPRKKMGEVPMEKILNLHNELQRILRLAIEQKGSTISTYSNLSGKGNFQNFLAIYGKSKCPENHNVEEIKQGGRGTNYCSTCQV